MTLEKSEPHSHAWGWIVRHSVVLALIAGLGEEPGWRGFALPRPEASYAPLFATAGTKAASSRGVVNLCSAGLQICHGGDAMN